MLRLIKPCPELENAYEDFRADWKANHDKIIPAAVRGRTAAARSAPARPAQGRAPRAR